MRSVSVYVSWPGDPAPRRSALDELWGTLSKPVDEPPRRPGARASSGDHASEKCWRVFPAATLCKMTRSNPLRTGRSRRRSRTQRSCNKCDATWLMAIGLGDRLEAERRRSDAGRAQNARRGARGPRPAIRSVSKCKRGYRKASMTAALSDASTLFFPRHTQRFWALPAAPPARLSSSILNKIHYLTSPGSLFFYSANRVVLTLWRL